jgi:membrane protein DedA with SNARE-associated domain
VADFIAWMNQLPDALVYLVLFGGAAIENVLPMIPADTFVALGGFLAGAGDLDARLVAGGTWVFNVAGALVVYRIAHSHGPTFFQRGLGRHIIRPHQMERMARFYEQWGTLAIFGSRFLPGVRAVVPVFAGVTHQPWIRVAVPLAAASAIWYGGLVWLGSMAGQNLDSLARQLEGMSRFLAGCAAIVFFLGAWWWMRTRRHPDE